MKKLLQISILVLLLLTYLIIGLSYAAPTCTLLGESCTPGSHNCDACTAESLSSTHVQAAINATARGGTVNLPAGDETWTSTVTYDRAIIIQGQGSQDTGTPCTTGTCIRNGMTKCTTTTCTNSSCATYLLSYTVSSSANATLDLPYTNRISGIRFDANYRGLGVSFRNLVTDFPLTNIIVDNNVFLDCWDCDYEGTDPVSPVLRFLGRFDGVVYNNSFYGWPYIGNAGGNTATAGSMANGVVMFNNEVFNVNYGTSGFMYYEDNYFYSDGPLANTGGSPFLITVSAGQKAVVRYNDFISNRTWGTQSKPWSPHHPKDAPSGKGGEFYGNYFRHTTGNINWSWGRPRAGKNLMFYNRLYTNNSGTQWTMYTPSTNPPATTTTACGSDVYAPWIGQYYCDKAGMPQHLWQSYQWVNKDGNTGTGVYTEPSVSDGDRLTANKHYYDCPGCVVNDDTYDSEKFTGATGVGCGTIGNRPATCTAGTAYWVPNASKDPTASSCENINAWVGRNNTIASELGGKIGTLYICGSNNWTNATIYQPYTYPHPLRGSDGIKPNNSLTSVCVGEDCTTPLTCEGGTCTVVITVTATDIVSVSGVKACLENGTTCVSSTAYASRGLSLTNTSGNTWALTLEGVEDDGSYAYNIKSIDSSGNESDNLIAAFDTESNSDITNPTLDTVVFDGINLALTFSEAVKDGGTYANSQWTFTADATPISLTCIESWNSDQLICTPASCVDKDATLLLDYNQPVGDDAITDIADNPLVDITDKAITNNGTTDCGTPPSGTSLFSHDETPAVSSVAGSAGNYGLEFSSTSGGYLTHGWFYKHVDMDGQTHTFSVWRDGEELERKVFTGETASGWQSIELDDAVEILPDTAYRISLNTSGSHYARIASYFLQAYTTGTFTVPFAGGKHALTSPITYPNTGSTSNFFVDFTFVPTGSSTWTVTVSNVSAAGYKCNVGATRIVDNGNATEVEVEVANGWKASFSGCGTGSTVQSGNDYTHTTAEITEDCTVEVTCSQRTSPLWTTP